MEPKRVGLYARCSTNDQTTDGQVSDLRRFADQRGWTVYREYVDKGISGAKDRRPALDELMADARKRKLDVILVWKFDRYARSAQHLLNSLAEFRSLGCDFCSVQDAVDTTTPYGKAMFTVIAAMAELERELIRQRVLHGVRRAKALGKQLGRPRKDVDTATAKELRAKGLTYAAIGKALGLSREKIRLAINPHPKTGGHPRRS